jgi:hypothetical protein
MESNYCSCKYITYRYQTFCDYCGKDRFRTYVECDGCGKSTNTWYDMREDGCFCPTCYCERYPDLVDEDDIKRAEDYEKGENENENI